MSISMSEEELREIENRFYRTTPGPWVSSSCDKGGSFIYSESPERAYFYHGEWIAHIAIDEDTRFITHAIEDIPKLLNEVKRLRKLLDKSMYNESMDAYCKKFGVEVDKKRNI